MSKIVLKAVSVFVLTFKVSVGLFAQPADISAVMSEIASNNKLLKAERAYAEGRALQNETLNNIDGLEISGAVLPFGNNSTGLYSEAQISQSFDFPSAYRVRSAYMEQDKLQQDAAWQRNRQAILSEAGDLCIQIIHQQKRKAVERERTQQARQVFEQINELYEREQVGKLDLNKAKIAWLQHQFSIEQVDAEIELLTARLRGLNGGLDIEFAGMDYEGSLLVEALDSLWLEKLVSDPVFRHREESERTAMAYVELQKKERLPEFDVGLNYEGVKGENYAGFAGGLTIPIWNRRNNVKAAEVQYIYEQQQSDAILTALYAEYAASYNRYIYLLRKFGEYQASLGAIDSGELLSKAYELGELSFLEYSMELKFYQEAYDEMLNMEMELHLLRNKLLKHTL